MVRDLLSNAEIMPLRSQVLVNEEQQEGDCGQFHTLSCNVTLV
jgi:hypothetical protein